MKRSAKSEMKHGPRKISNAHKVHSAFTKHLKHRTQRKVSSTSRQIWNNHWQHVEKTVRNHAG